METDSKLATLRGHLALLAFKGCSSSIVIPNLRDVDEFAFSAKSHKADVSQELHEKKIQEKFLEAQVNMQTFDAARRAKQNPIYNSKPSQPNESDAFFKSVPNVVASKTDAQLSLIDPAQARVVTNYLTGCADLNSYRGGLADFQHSGEGVRLERHLGARA